MSAINALNAFDWSTVTEADLSSLTMDEILGIDIADVNLSQNLPDGVYALIIEDFEKVVRAADPSQDKKGSVSVRVKLHVLRCLATDDPSLDKEALAGRKHMESFNMSNAYGPRNITQLILGVVGTSWRNKTSIAEVTGTLGSLLEELKAGKVAFGVQIKTVERNGYENCSIVYKEKSFINMNALQTLPEMG
jgi:hypothetical protein